MTKEEKRIYDKEYSIKNKEKKKKYYKEYYLENTDKKKKVATKWAKDNPEKTKTRLRTWKNKNPERKRELDRIGLLRRKYNITLEQYNDMLYEQDNKCFICKVDQKDISKTLCVDHDHNTGKVRRLLCNQCNTGLGSFKDNVNLLQMAVDYLNYFKNK